MTVRTGFWFFPDAPGSIVVDTIVAAEALGIDEVWLMGEDGKPAAPGLVPTLEQSVRRRAWLVGTPEEVAAGIQFYRDGLGLENLVVFPHFGGDPYAETHEQLAPIAEDVLPLLDREKAVPRA